MGSKYLDQKFSHLWGEVAWLRNLHDVGSTPRRVADHVPVAQIRRYLLMYF